jgi:hypothetical protein
MVTRSDDGVFYTQPRESPRNGDGNLPVAVTGDEQTDWSGWEHWMEGHKELLRGELLEAIAESMVIYVGERDDKIAALERQVRDLELRLAEAAGAIDILRGKGAPNALRMRGTYDDAELYLANDVVALNGSSFAALRDNPGACPGDNWQLMASAGKRGERGQRGPQGERGMAAPVLRWITFDTARMALSILMTDGSSTRIPLVGVFKSVRVDPSDYSIKVTMSDGAELAFSVRSLFEQFLDETAKGR